MIEPVEYDPADYPPPAPGEESQAAYEVATGQRVVGPNPNPEPPETVHLEVMFSLSDGSTVTKWFAIPPEYYAQSMTLSMKRGTKNLGPILRSNFYFHEDSKQLHTICRRQSDIISEEDEPPTGPEIDVLEY